GQAFFTYCISFVVCSRLRIHSKSSRNAPVAAALVVSAFGLVCYAAQSWISLEHAVQRFSLIRDLAVVLAPLAYLMYFTFTKSVRLDKESIKESLKMRLPEFEQASERIAWVLLSYGLIGSLLLNASAHVINSVSQGSAATPVFWTALQVFNL